MENNDFITQILPEKIYSKIQFPTGDFEIKKGGGTRRFFRIKYDKENAILCIYDDSKEENAYYAQIALFLKSLGLPVPEIYEYDAGLKFLIMKDLGVADLYSTQNQQDRIRGFNCALRTIAKLHKEGLDIYKKSPFPIMQDGFNQKYYHWEAEYFFKNAIEDGLQLELSNEEKNKFWDETDLRIDFLLKLPKQLIHRDFQSQNILWNSKENKLGIIDFQGMRIGTGFYDVASLIYDPYLIENKEGREIAGDLLESYLNEMGLQKSDPGVIKAFEYAAIQRLTQACGAYFFLSDKMGKSHFRQYVSCALSLLQKILSKRNEFPYLKKIIELAFDKELSINPL